MKFSHKTASTLFLKVNSLFADARNEFVHPTSSYAINCFHCYVYTAEQFDWKVFMPKSTTISCRTSAEGHIFVYGYYKKMTIKFSCKSSSIQLKQQVISRQEVKVTRPEPPAARSNHEICKACQDASDVMSIGTATLSLLPVMVLHRSRGRSIILMLG